MPEPIRTITIFLSYAREDTPFANEIRQRLSRVFPFPLVAVRYMSEFELGLNWRDQIDQVLDTTDILLIIATGREKPSHSFTGYEVGYFRKAIHHHPSIDDKPDLKRLIIPFAICADIPDTVKEFQGVGIAATDSFFYELEKAEKVEGDPFLKLLERIDDILNQLNSIHLPSEGQRARSDAFHHEAQSFYQNLKLLMSSLLRSAEHSKPRLTVRLPADIRPTSLEIDDRVRLSCEGPTGGIFGKELFGADVTWPEFSKLVGSESAEVALHWNDALCSLIGSAIENKLVESGLVPSYDQNKFFRLFVPESKTFMDGRRELDVYLVEPRKDVGDPFTTFLAKAMATVLEFRSLFFEVHSPYGDQVSFWRAEEWKPRINELREDLRNLFIQTRAGGITKPDNIARLFRDDQKAIENMRTMQRGFREATENLYKSANSVLAESNPTEATFDAFARALDAFRKKSIDVNAVFAVKVVEQLDEVLREEWLHIPRPPPDKPSTAETSASQNGQQSGGKFAHVIVEIRHLVHAIVHWLRSCLP